MDPYATSKAATKYLMSAIFATCLLAVVALAGATTTGYPSWGGDLRNTRHVSTTDINRNNVGTLQFQCEVLTGGRPCAVVTVSGDARQVAYYSITEKTTGAGGNVTAFYVDNCEIKWSVFLPTLLGVPGAYARSTPTIVENEVVLFTRLGGNSFGFTLNRFTGALVKRGTSLNADPYAVVTASPRWDPVNRQILIGVSSTEITAAANPLYPCCRHHGSFAALRFDSPTLQLNWQTSTIKLTYDGEDTPQYPGQFPDYTGAPVWNSEPPIDYTIGENGIVVAGTGQNYNVTKAWEACVNKSYTDCGANTFVTLPYHPNVDLTCLTPKIEACEAAYSSDNNHFDSIISFDLKTGAMTWTVATGKWDVFTTACATATASTNDNCPSRPGTDSDFGQSPINIQVPKIVVAINHPEWNSWYRALIAKKFEAEFGIPLPDLACMKDGPGFAPLNLGQSIRTIPAIKKKAGAIARFLLWLLYPNLKVVVVGQKSGTVWVVEREFGMILWSNQPVTYGFRGGMQWGASYMGPEDEEDVVGTELVYFQNTNDEHFNYTLLGKSSTAGSVFAYNPATNKVVWNTPCPEAPISTDFSKRVDEYVAPVLTTPGLVHEPAVSGKYYAFNSDNGAVLFTYDMHGGGGGGGATVLKRSVVIPTGYAAKNPTVPAEAPKIVVLSLRSQ